MFSALDRRTRNQHYLLTITERTHVRGASLQMFHPLYDTSTPQGKLFFQMLGTVTELEHDLIRKYAIECLKRAEANDKHCGRLFMPDERHVDQMAKLLKSETSLADLIRIFGVSPSAERRYLTNSGH